MHSQVRSFFQKTTAIAAIASLITSVTLDVANALPQGGTVVNGTAAINTAGNVMNVDQTTTRADINWNSFNIGAPETVNFNSANASDVTINRVNAAAGRSMIEGMLNSNHRVAVLNDAGITFTAGSRVNVGSLIATTAKNFDQTGSNLSFTNVNGAGSVVNHGEINVSEGGYAVLVAPEVNNTGTINARLGHVDLASANGFTLDLNGNGKINYLAGPDMTKSIVSNSGTINNLGGVVTFQSDKAANIANSVINLNGVINVDGMDSNVIGTTPNGSAIFANANGNINAGSELRAGQIQLASNNGNITTAALTSINNKTNNTVKAIDVQAPNGRVTVNGKITAINAKKVDESKDWEHKKEAGEYEYDLGNLKEIGGEGRANAEVNIKAGKGVVLNQDVKVFAVNHAGGDAKLTVDGGTGPLVSGVLFGGQGEATTHGLIDVYAAGTRYISRTDPNGSGGGDILSTATADFKGVNIHHSKDVNIKAFAFHDIRTIIDFVSSNSTEKTAFGFYEKDANGNPVGTGEILFADVSSLGLGSWADLSFVDFSDVGFFIIPDASAIQAGLTNRQVVTFDQVGGNWVVKDLQGNIIKAKDHGVGQNYALFSGCIECGPNGTSVDINPDGLAHLVNSSGANGNMNWETLSDALCAFDDFNFNSRTVGTSGNVKTHAAYTANASGWYYTPVVGANIYVDSGAQAKNSEATAEFRTTAYWAAIGDPRITSRAYKNAHTKVSMETTNSDLIMNAPMTALSYAKSRYVGSANSDLSLIAHNGNLLIGWQGAPTGYALADARGGVKANADTYLKGNTIQSRTPSGARATTVTGENATANTTLNSILGATYDGSAYSFAYANGSVASGRGTVTAPNAKLTVVKNGTITRDTTYVAGSGDHYTPYANAVDCNDNPCTVNPNTPDIGGWRTTTTVTGGAHQTSTGTYGSGVDGGAIGFDPYRRIAIHVVPKSPPPPELDPNLLFPDPEPEPEFVKKEPASGGGLFCRDVNTAGVPGLCGPAPVREPEVALAPPVYATPFKKGPSKTEKKAQVADLEPGSGNKCLVVNGKKVCIEEQIDK